ncbi:MAG: hypothetical protein CVU55_06045 [Deltaproteobacteria bacterium HGW-Deltaproteobacteria-13]|jgi:opacity protein-like surface antigen|nr:MAG: hypothetical protein CVU55_06045 [Deltaproteobacteria bacterium HGW-Deltaproteobacteria-13]
MKKAMKRILFILFLFIALAAAANAAEFQKCVDKDGNVLITDNPPPGAKCESSGGEGEPIPQEIDSAKNQENELESEQAEQKDKTSSQQTEIKRLKKIPRVSY